MLRPDINISLYSVLGITGVAALLSSPALVCQFLIFRLTVVIDLAVCFSVCRNWHDVLQSVLLRDISLLLLLNLVIVLFSIHPHIVDIEKDSFIKNYSVIFILNISFSCMDSFFFFFVILGVFFISLLIFVLVAVFVVLFGPLASSRKH